MVNAETVGFGKVECNHNYKCLWENILQLVLLQYLQNKRFNKDVWGQAVYTLRWPSRGGATIIFVNSKALFVNRLKLMRII